MATYSYVDKAGKNATIEAASGEEALSKSASLANPRSGVQLEPTKPPVPAGTDPTIANSPVRRYKTNSAGVGAGSTTGKANKIYEGLQIGAVDENAIRSTMRDQAQGQLDAIKASFEAVKARNAITALDNAGKTRAGAARSGVLGSDFGDAAVRKDAENSDRIVAENEAAQANAIALVLRNADERADTKIANENTNRTANRAVYLKHLEDTSAAARTDIVNLAKSGVELDKLTDDVYTKLLDQTGFTPEQLKAQFIINTPDPIYKGVSGSKYIVVRRNPSTGEVKSDSFDLGFTPPQDYRSTTLDTGQVIFTPEKWDGDPSKIITYGTPSAKYLSEVNRNNAGAAKDWADASGKKDSEEYTIGKSARNDLLKGGLSVPAIDNLQKDIRLHGLQEVLKQQDPATAAAIQQILDKNYVVSG